MRQRPWLVAAAVAALALACAAAALAATPKPGKYRGKTSQDRSVRLKINDAGRIPRDGFKIHWQAPCQVKQDMAWTDVTHNTRRIELEDDGSFELDAKYKHTVGDFTGHIKIETDGKFDTKTSASGTFKARVRVTEDGDYVDTCKKTVNWSVSD
ncbi:MAG TPA: hypothetical protein VJT75_03200 [Thermoleophilaceae bacterium]|nr:hypothetical protein [Thermoleophilaceae bacterium]